jgi:cysteine desulfurase
MWQKNVRYLDYNASSGVSPYVRDQLVALLKNEEVFLANPSSRHRLGQKMQHFLYDSARVIASSLGGSVSPDELIFTASGTEANQTVLRSLEKDVEGMIIGAGEHSASHDLLPLFGLSFVHELPLLREGSYDLQHLKHLLSLAKESGLKKIGLSLFWANNETGALNHLTALKSVIQASGIEVLLHLDGAQVWGKLTLNVTETPAHFVTFSSHKIGAPAGVGVIWKRVGAPFHPLILGSQARGLRGGTENLIGILATRFACEKMKPMEFQLCTRPLQIRLEAGLIALNPDIEIWGWQDARLTNTTRFSFKNFSSYENWVELLDLKGFAVSHGSACKARVVEPSRVLLKMGATRESALNSVRVSFGPTNTEKEVDDLLAALSEILVKKGVTQ